jgi:UDPglucose 6-dehydrogenase
LNGYKVIVTKSTVPVGAASRIKKIIEENKTTNTRFSVAANPEFLREGAAINDFMRPDRVVIGCTDDEAVAILKDIYRPLYIVETPFVITTPESAEMIKYASNAFLATKVSFINEISGLCERLELTSTMFREYGNGCADRVEVPASGPGFGGSCFPKDAQALVALGRSVDYEVRIVDAALRVNETQKNSIIDRIKRLLTNLGGKTVGSSDWRSNLIRMICGKPHH